MSAAVRLTVLCVYLMMVLLSGWCHATNLGTMRNGRNQLIGLINKRLSKKRRGSLFVLRLLSTQNVT